MSDTVEKRTEHEIEGLKRNWLADPCWDIYETEGFEAHREELKVFQREMEEQWDKKELQKIYDKSVELGCNGNYKLARYVMRLERRIDELEARAV